MSEPSYGARESRAAEAWPALDDGAAYRSGNSTR